MAGEQVTYTLAIDPELLPAGDLSGLLSALEDLQPLLTDLGEIQREAQIANFASQGENFGEPWAPLAESTLSYKMSQYGFDLPLIRTGRLQGEIGGEIEETGDTVTTGIGLAGFDEPYPVYLGEGAPKRNLPARVLVGVSQDEVNTMEEAIVTYEQEAGLPSGAISISVGVAI